MAILLLFFIFLCSLLLPFRSSSSTFSFLDPQLGARRSQRITFVSCSLISTPLRRYDRVRTHSTSDGLSATGSILENFPFQVLRSNSGSASSLSACVSLSRSFPPSYSTCSDVSFSSSVLVFFTLGCNSCLYSATSAALQSRPFSFLPARSIPIVSSYLSRILSSRLSSPWNISCTSAAFGTYTSACPSVVASRNSHPYSPSHLSPLFSPASVASTRLNVYRNKVRHINPVRRVKHLRRNSGQTHVHELARERYLLHRQKDVRDYCRLMLSPHQHLSPSSCPHSQRNAAIKHPFRGVNKARKKEFARLNREDDAKDERRLQELKAFLDQQKRVLLHTQETDEASSTPSQNQETEGDNRVLGERIVSAYAELQQLLKKRRMLRPLGSNKLFICNVDGRLANSDLEDFFDFFFEQTRVKLHKNAGVDLGGVAAAVAYHRADGSHRGSGIIRFTDTLQATQCLLEFNGVRLGEKNIFLAEALGPPLKKKERKTYPRPPFPNGVVTL